MRLATGLSAYFVQGKDTSVLIRDILLLGCSRTLFETKYGLRLAVDLPGFLGRENAVTKPPAGRFFLYMGRTGLDLSSILDRKLFSLSEGFGGSVQSTISLVSSTSLSIVTGGGLTGV